jgi:hypothetical protein
VGTETLLRYAAITDPFPLKAARPESQARAQLTIVATNPSSDPGGKPVVLQGIRVTLPIGKEAHQLSVDAAGIAPVPPAGWRTPDTSYPTGAVQYTFRPQASTARVGAEALTFIFNNVQVNSQPGTVAVEVMEGSGGCSPAKNNCPTTQLAVTKFPASWGQVDFSVHPTDVPRGAGPTLSWSGPDGATYTIDYTDWGRGKDVTLPPPGQRFGPRGRYPGLDDPPLHLVRTTTFTLNVEQEVGGLSYHAQDQRTVEVIDRHVTIVSMGAEPTYVPPDWPVKLRWKTEAAEVWRLNGPGIDDEDVPVPPPDDAGYQVQPGYPVTVRKTGTYGLTARDAAGNELRETVRVTVDPSIVTGTHEIVGRSMPGWAGLNGRDGFAGIPGRMAPRDPTPGGSGGPGPFKTDVEVTIASRHDWLLFVTVVVGSWEEGHEEGHTETLVMTPSAHLTVRAIGGAGGAGGRGGSAVRDASGQPIGQGRDGGNGGDGGVGGDIVVRCPAALLDQAQKCVFPESVGGPGGAGGAGGEPGGRSGSPGRAGSPGEVRWLAT